MAGAQAPLTAPIQTRTAAAVAVSMCPACFVPAMSQTPLPLPSVRVVLRKQQTPQTGTTVEHQLLAAMCQPVAERVAGQARYMLGTTLVVLVVLAPSSPVARITCNRQELTPTQQAEVVVLAARLFLAVRAAAGTTGTYPALLAEQVCTAATVATAQRAGLALLDLPKVAAAAVAVAVAHLEQAAGEKSRCPVGKPHAITHIGATA